MKKKETSESNSIVGGTVVSDVHTKQPIGLLSASFSQEDLNKMVDKINEIIVALNKVL